MADAAIFPITSPTSPNYHATQVHNAVFIPNSQPVRPDQRVADPSAQRRLI